MGSKSDDSINIAHHELKTYSSESTSSGSTISERNNACQQDTTATKHAVILDIDPHTRTPRDGMVFRKPSVEELLRRGPAKVMAEAKQHSTKVRWVHLRSNVMWWVEELMDRVCEERRIRITDHESDRPGTPTHNNPLLRKDLWYHLFHGESNFLQTCVESWSVTQSDVRRPPCSVLHASYAMQCVSGMPQPGGPNQNQDLFHSV